MTKNVNFINRPIINAILILWLGDRMNKFIFNVKDIAAQYGFKNGDITIEEIKNGNINNTFVMIINDGERISKYLCQRVNTKVFTKPFLLMRNIQNVTTYINNFYKRNDDNKHCTLNVIPTLTGSPLYIAKNALGDNEYFRMYNYINEAVSYDSTDNREIIYNIGRAFGNFARALNGYPTDLVDETIENFHNTAYRYQQLSIDLEHDFLNRAKDVKEEIEFFRNHASEYSDIYSLLETGKIISRVTHNDTKINNVMMDKNGEFIAVIDLDTVMPGTILFDYGDGIRSSCSTALEDEQDISKIDLNLKLFEAYTNGYLEEIASCLNECEVDNMCKAIKIITIELGMRFFNDYINGDIYFKTNYPTHNLVRARNQIALVKKIEEKYEVMNDTIHKIYKKCR